MILLIDNYDSFTYNLYQYIGELYADVKVVRNDEITIPEIEALAPQALIFSPGPGYPRIVERILLVGLGVGNNGGESGLGAGAGGGGNREERRQLLAYFELSAHLLNGLIRADDSCSRTLGAVHRRTAAESDEALAAVVKIELADFLDIVSREDRKGVV